jgi:hypothetical protein
MDAAAEYNELLARDPAAALEQAGRLETAFRSTNITFGGEPMRSFLRPHFVGRADWDWIRKSAQRLIELASRVARHAFDGDVRSLCALLGTPEAEVPWVAHDPGPPDVLLSRVDAFVGDRSLHFIEVNSDAPAGFGYGDQMAEVIGASSAFREFARTHRLSYQPSAPPLVEEVLRLGRGLPPAPQVAIVDFAEVKTRPDQELLARRFHARGAHCRLVDPRQVELSRGRMVADGIPIDIVYRRGLLSELLEREDEVRAFLRGYREGLAVFVNSLRCRLAEDKAFLALLTDESFAGLLSRDEIEFVERHVPWTRKLEERHTSKAGRSIDLVPFVIANREALVLKPSHGYGGRSVFVGDETPEPAWRAAVGEGLGAGWVVQERVAIPEEVFPVIEDGRLAFDRLKLNANPFYIGGADAGAVARASRSSVINVSAGGGSVPTFVVE